MIVASDLKPIERNTLKAFLSLELRPSGLILRDCSYHRHPDGREWIGLPAKPQIDSEGRQRKDPATGKALYVPIVEIRGKQEREKFQAAALAAVHALVGGDSR